MVTISVIIPTYNRARTIAPAIESVCAQTRDDREIIVIDDGSSDDTEARLRCYAPNIRYERQPNQGQAVARNRGAKLSRAKWLAFLDSDDTWREQKLARQVAFAEEHNMDVCFHDLAMASGDNIIISSRNNDAHKDDPAGKLKTGRVDDPFQRILQGCAIFFTSTLIVRRELFEQIGGFAPTFRMNEDIDLYLRLCDVARFGFLDEPLTVRLDGSNWESAESYEYRARAIRRYLCGCPAAKRGNAKRALARELRVLGGHLRRDGRLRNAGSAYIRACMARIIA